MGTTIHPPETSGRVEGPSEKTLRLLLRLLDESAPAASFEQAVQSTGRLLSAEATQRLGQDMARALKINERLTLHKKRESELLALYETARDLSGLRNTDDVLSAIVQRARQLVGSDIGYLSAADKDHGDFFVRATEGVISERFRAIRIPRNVGICGTVVVTRSPYYSSDYQDDPTFSRDPHVDANVRNEGIVSILGIPLQVEQEVIGVLFVGDRYVRSYTPQEVAVLSSLAAFAALAINNASLFEEAQEALQKATTANAQLARKAADIQAAADAHEQLTNLIARGGSLEDLASMVATFLEGRIEILDDRHRLLCSAEFSQGDGRQTSYAEAAKAPIARALRESTTLGRSVVATTDPLVCRVAAVLGGADRFGALVLWRDKDLTPPEVRTFERSAIVTAIVLLSVERLNHAAFRTAADLVSALLRQSEDASSAFHTRLSKLDLPVQWPATLFLVDLGTFRASLALAPAQAVAGSKGSLIAEYNGQLVLITSSPEPERLAANLQDKLEEDLGMRFSIAFSHAVDDPIRLPHCYRSAQRNLRMLRSLGQHGKIAPESLFGMYSLVFADKGESDIEALIRATIGQLRDHDARRGSQLVSTLLSYLDHGQNAKQTARELDIHVNTLRQRLDTIEAICPRWNDPSRILETHMALKLCVLSSAAG